MYTSRYNWKRHETLNKSDGQKIKKIQHQLLIQNPGTAEVCILCRKVTVFSLHCFALVAEHSMYFRSATTSHFADVSP